MQASRTHPFRRHSLEISGDSTENMGLLSHVWGRKTSWAAPRWSKQDSSSAVRSHAVERTDTRKGEQKCTAERAGGESPPPDVILCNTGPRELRVCSAPQASRTERNTCRKPLSTSTCYFCVHGSGSTCLNDAASVSEIFTSEGKAC